MLSDRPKHLKHEDDWYPTSDYKAEWPEDRPFVWWPDTQRYMRAKHYRVRSIEYKVVPEGTEVHLATDRDTFYEWAREGGKRGN